MWIWVNGLCWRRSSPPCWRYSPPKQQLPPPPTPQRPPLVLPRQDDGDGTVTISGELKAWHKVTLSLQGPYAHELDNRPNPFTFGGKIAWSSAKGFGVKFDKIGESQSEILNSFIEKTD